MSLDTRFASKLERVDDAPEPLRGALRRRLPPEETISLLAYSPAHASAGAQSPATALAVTDRGWLVVSEESGGAEAAGCAFDDTLLVELSEILLLGTLKIHFAPGGETRSGCVTFNTVMEALYREAAELVLKGIGPASETARGEALPAAALEDWPMKFRNAVIKALPKGRRLLAATCWAPVSGGFQRRLAPAVWKSVRPAPAELPIPQAPAGALALTEREILLIVEHEAEDRLRAGDRQSYGNITTYLPLARCSRAGLSHHDRFSILALEAHGRHGGEKLEIILPPGDPGVAKFVEKVGRSDV